MPNYLEGNFSAVAIRKRGNMWQFQNKLDCRCPSEYLKECQGQNETIHEILLQWKRMISFFFVLA